MIASTSTAVADNDDSAGVEVTVPPLVSDESPASPPESDFPTSESFHCEIVVNKLTSNLDIAPVNPDFSDDGYSYDLECNDILNGF